MILRRSLTVRTSGDADNGYHLASEAELLDGDGWTVWSIQSSRSQDHAPTEAERRAQADYLLAVLNARIPRQLANTYGDPIRV